MSIFVNDKHKKSVNVFLSILELVKRTGVSVGPVSGVFRTHLHRNMRLRFSTCVVKVKYDSTNVSEDELRPHTKDLMTSSFSQTQHKVKHKHICNIYVRLNFTLIIVFGCRQRPDL